MALSRLSTADEILRAGRELDLRDRSISSQDVGALARVISTSTALEVLSLYNVRLSSDVSCSRVLYCSSYMASCYYIAVCCTNQRCEVVCKLDVHDVSVCWCVGECN